MSPSRRHTCMHASSRQQSTGNRECRLNFISKRATCRFMKPAATRASILLTLKATPRGLAVNRQHVTHRTTEKSLATGTGFNKIFLPASFTSPSKTAITSRPRRLQQPTLVSIQGSQSASPAAHANVSDSESQSR